MSAARPGFGPVLWKGETVLSRRRPHVLVPCLAPAAFLVAVVLAGPLIYRASPTAMDLAHTLAPPGPGHIMGTDDYGRDILARVLAGGRSSILTSLAAVIPAAILGTLLGGVAAANEAAGWLAMKVAELFLSLPLLIGAMLVLSAAGSGRVGLWATLFLFGWMPYVRLARDLSRKTMQLEYVTASKAAGAGHWWIFTHHILPAVLPSALSYGAMQAGSMVLLAAELGFLGFGVQPPIPDWGLMLAEGRAFLRTAPWLLVWPVLALGATVLSFQLAGRAARRSLSHRTEAGRL